MQKPNNDDLEKEVIIKLKKWQIPYLLGAARLGIWCEDWCAGLIQTACNSYDTHSGKWILKVGYIIDLIKEQTGIKEEEKEYGYDDALKNIEEWVNKQCKQNEEEMAKWEEERYREYQAKEKTPEEIEAEERFKKQIVSVPVTDEIMKEVCEWVGKIEAEKR